MTDYRLRQYRKFPNKQVYQVVIYLTPSQSPLVHETTFNKQIEEITDKQVQSNVAASTAIISGIALNQEIIQRLLRSDIMKESVIYQEM
jgi:predicted transposase YdaD